MLTKFFDTERLIHSIKTTIACLVGFLLSKFIGFHADQWVVITIIVVMCAQIYVGSVIQKAYLRLLGTMVGCLFAITIILTLGHSDLIIAFTIGLASFFFSYLATSNENLTYAGTLGAVTTAIIMLGQIPTVTFATERFLEISVGILIATVISQFVLPIHARTHLRRNQAKCLEQLRDYYNACIVTHEADAEALRYEDFDEGIVKSLSRQRQLAKEALREPFGETFDAKLCVKLLQYEKEILRSVDFMHSALVNIKHAEILILQSPAFKAFNDAILNSLTALITVISHNGTSKVSIQYPPLEALVAEVEKNSGAFAHDERVYVDGFLFSAEILANSLTKLAHLFNVSILNNPL